MTERESKGGLPSLSLTARNMLMSIIVIVWCIISTMCHGFFLGFGEGDRPLQAHIGLGLIANNNNNNNNKNNNIKQKLPYNRRSRLPTTTCSWVRV